MCVHNWELDSSECGLCPNGQKRTFRPDPKPALRKRGKLPTVLELGGRCQACGSAKHVERAHLLGGILKEDDVDLIAVLCGDFGDCRVHPRSHREDTARAKAEIRRCLSTRQKHAIINRVGRTGLDRLYPGGPA